MEGTDRARRAIVTGSRQGIGAAIAQALARAGHSVMICARSGPEAMAESATRLQAETGSRVASFTGDLTREEDIGQLHDAAVSVFVGVDILVNNAGGFLEAPPALQTQRQDWQQQLDVNLTSPFLLSQRFLPAMIEQGWGRIVNIGSVVARSPAPGNAIGYVAAKAGLVGMSRQLALEVARTGVTVNVVHPGSIGTEHLDDYFMTAPDGTKQHLMDNIPLGRLGRAPEVAAIIPYLVSEDAAFTTGASIDVNGGAVMA
jgi:NAD(P)-dependent dehydrogenase (short-subunit alcohol dehydrogenase family)